MQSLADLPKTQCGELRKCQVPLGLCFPLTSWAVVHLEDDTVKRDRPAGGISAEPGGAELRATLHSGKKSEGNEIAFAQGNASNFSVRANG